MPPTLLVDATHHTCNLQAATCTLESPVSIHVCVHIYSRPLSRLHSLRRARSSMTLQISVPLRCGVRLRCAAPCCLVATPSLQQFHRLQRSSRLIDTSSSKVMAVACGRSPAPTLDRRGASFDLDLGPLVEHFRRFAIMAIPRTMPACFSGLPPVTNISAVFEVEHRGHDRAKVRAE